MADERLEQMRARAMAGGAKKYHEKNREQGKLFVRDRLKLLLDNGLEVEDGLYANCSADDLPADGVVTGIGRIHGRKVAVMANDSTVKAGSWGARTVEKILRIQETAEKLHIPLSISWIRPGHALPTRSRCFLAGAAPGGSSTTKFA